MMNTPERVAAYIERYADDNEAEADRLVVPWGRIKFRARAAAFRTAARLVRRHLVDGIPVPPARPAKEDRPSRNRCE